MPTSWRSHTFPLLFLLVIGLWCTKPLFHSGLFTAHDIWHQVARIYHYTHALQDGQFPPAWVATMAQGNGYPLFIFSYHLPWMIGAPLLLSGLSIETSLKLLFGGSYILSGYAFYWFAYKFSRSSIAALCGAALYLIAPFHFLSVYVSASIGTTFMFMLLPLIFGGIYLVGIEGKHSDGVFLGAVAVAAAVLTHLMTLVMMAPFIAISALGTLMSKKTHSVQAYARSLGAYVVMALLAFLLAAFYLVPLFLLLPNTKATDAGNGFSELYTHNLVYLRQLIYSPWGFGPIISEATDGEISVQVGIAQWIAIGGLIAAVVASRIFPRSIHQTLLRSHFKQMSLTVAMFVLTTCAMTTVSVPFWRVMTGFVSVDYPFRLLTLSIFWGSLAAVYLLVFLKNSWMQKIVTVLLICIALYTNRNHVRVNLYTHIPVSDYIQAETTTNSFNEYLPDTANSYLLTKERQPPVVENIPARIVEQTTRSLSVAVTASNSQTITLRQFDFPGQTARINGVFTPHHLDELGRIQLPIEAGSQIVQVSYTPTRAQSIASIVSCGTLIVCFFIWYSGSLKKYDV